MLNRFILRAEVKAPRNHLRRIYETLKSRGYPHSGMTFDEVHWTYPMPDGDTAVKHARVILAVLKNVVIGLPSSGSVNVVDLQIPGSDGVVYSEKF